MRRITLLAGALLTAACAAPSADGNQEEAATTSPLEGTFEYVGTLQGQGIIMGGRYVFLYGPPDGSAAMTGEAGTYQISGDTATHTVTYSTDAASIGSVFKWTVESTSGDTVAYIVMNESGEVTGRGRAVRRR